MEYRYLMLFSLGMGMVAACSHSQESGNDEASASQDSVFTEYGASVYLAHPSESASVTKYAKVIGWPENESPMAPPGYKVVKFAGELNSPRHIYVAPNSDIFVAESRTEKSEESEKSASRNAFSDKSPNRITLFRDANNDGIAEQRFTFLENLKQPFGMLVWNGFFYVANTDGVWRYPYQEGDTRITTQGEKVLDLPAGGYNNHWTRNLGLSADSSKIYVTVGSGSNVAENGIENEKRRANILEINPDGSGERIYASGLRNPVGIGLEPSSHALWVAVNERDELGDELVPDYITRVQENGFYGWPYAYWGKHPDPRLKGAREDLVAESIIPDFAVGAHTASLGLAFPNSSKFPAGAYVGQHGSWNRSAFVGFKVLFVPFSGGRPTGEYRDFLTGFIADQAKNEVFGRPVSITFSKQGYMLVADDAGNVVWAVVPN